MILVLRAFLTGLVELRSTAARIGWAWFHFCSATSMTGTGHSRIRCQSVGVYRQVSERLPVLMTALKRFGWQCSIIHWCMFFSHTVCVETCRSPHSERASI